MTSVAGRKKPAVGATVPPPSEKADFFTQLQGTFERGVVSAEVDVGGLLNERGGGKSVLTAFGEAAPITSGPAGVHDQIFRKMKDIANTFGGRFTVHAPMQANPSETMPVGQTKAAALLKQTADYAARLGAGVVTVHPIGQMEAYFIDPFVGTKMPLPNVFYLAKNEKELDQLMDKLNVHDPIVKSQVRQEWRNFINTIPMHFAEKFGSIATQDMDNFADLVARKDVGELLLKHRNNPQALLKKIDEMKPLLHPQVRQHIDLLKVQLFTPDGRLNEHQVNDLLKNLDRYRDESLVRWRRVAMTSFDPIDENGAVVPLDDPELVRKAKKGKLTRREVREVQSRLREKAWEHVVGAHERFGPFEDSEKVIMDSIQNTFRKFFRGIKEEKGQTYKLLKKGKLKLALENLFPAAPEKGVMMGYAYFYTPEHMAKVIRALRRVAKEEGFSPDVVTMTFDIGHAAASSHVLRDKKGRPMTPSQFLKALRKEGINPEHFHIVGGPGYGHQHIAWGDWLDEVSRMDPGIINELVDAGVINIEGGAGLHDVEVTLNAMWNEGLPLEAMLAVASSPEGFTPSMAPYGGFAPGPYLEGGRLYAGGQLPQRAFYSFQAETVGAPLMTSYGNYSMPGLFGGGYSIGPGATPRVWASSQPLLYSSKSNNEG